MVSQISIVIPTYNGERFIEKALLSVINQTRKPDEIIIHDDNSNDNTREICLKYSSQIKLIHSTKGPSGFVNGWNNAIIFATSEYIAILHQDDILYPTFIEEMVNAITENPDVKHLFSLCDYINENGVITNHAIKNAPNPLNEIVHRYSGIEYFRAYQQGYVGAPHIHRCPGVVTHRSIFENDCYYNPKAGHIADDDFFYRVGQYTDVVGILEPLAAYRIHHFSETGSIGDIKLVERLSNDYIFQIEQWKNSTFIQKNDYRFFLKLAFKFNIRNMAYSLRSIKILSLIRSIGNLLKIVSYRIVK